MQIVTGDRARIVGDRTGDGGHPRPHRRHRGAHLAPAPSADDTDQVERVIVANADQMLIVVAAADPEPRERLVDRYLVAALDAGVRPLLVVTKTDLADPSEFLAHFEGLDLEVFTSAQQEMPLERIGAAARRALHRLRRPLRRRQVDPRECPRARARCARPGM